MLSVIVPAYNEERAIGRTLEALSSYLSESFPDFEIVVVSDGSRDRTFEIAQGFESERIKVFEYRPNRGKGNALRYGFGKTRGDQIVFYDTGLDFPVFQVGEFLGILEEERADLVIGSKRHKESVVGYPFTRRIVSFGAQVLVKALFNLSVTDTQVGLKAFRRPVLEKVVPRILVKRYAFDVELLALAQHYGFKIIEAPVKLNLGFSTAFSFVGKNSIWNCLVDTLAVFYRLRILKFYDRPEAERARLVAEYRTAPWDYAISVISRFFGGRNHGEKT